jgi:hypothetical protein
VHEVVLPDGTVERIPPPPEFRTPEPLAGPAPFRVGPSKPAGSDTFSVLSTGGGPQASPTRSWVGTSIAGGYDKSAELSTGRTRRLPLGTVAGARSGDKGGDANVGIWVRSAAAYPWLENLISEETVRELLPETASLPLRITRLPNINAVNVVIEGLLGEGAAYHARFDPQAKGLAEWLRSRHVDIPVSLLEEAP